MPEDIIGNIASGEDSGKRGCGAVRFCDDGAIVFHIDLAAKELGLRLVSDCDEHAINFELGDVAGLIVVDCRAVHGEGVIVAEDFADFAIPDRLDFWVSEEARLQHSFGAQFVAAMDEQNFGGEFCEEQGFFGSGAATADDDDFFIAIKEAITGGAGRDAEAFEFFF